MNTPITDKKAENRIVRCFPREIVDAQLARIFENGIRNVARMLMTREYDEDLLLDYIDEELTAVLQEAEVYENSQKSNLQVLPNRIK